MKRFELAKTFGNPADYQGGEFVEIREPVDLSDAQLSCLMATLARAAATGHTQTAAAQRNLARAAIYEATAAHVLARWHVPDRTNVVRDVYAESAAALLHRIRQAEPQVLALIMAESAQTIAAVAAVLNARATGEAADEFARANPLRAAGAQSA